MNKTASPPLLTPAEAQEELAELGVDVTVTTVLNWCRDRGWGVRLPNDRWMVRRSKLDELIEETKHAESGTDEAQGPRP